MNKERGITIKTRYHVTMDKELKDTLQEVAKKNNRSLNAEIIHRLEKSIHRPASLLSLNK